MCYKLDRSLFGILVAVMLIAPPVQALNDDVAVQLLERLNDLEGEVNALRTENEGLKDKLEGAPTRAEDEEQVKAEATQASTEDGVQLDEQAKSTELESTEPQIPGVNLIVEDAAVGVTDTTDIPPLEQAATVETTESVLATEAKAEDPATAVPAQTDFLTTSPADAAPALLNAGAATVSTEAADAATTEVAPTEAKPTEAASNTASATPVEATSAPTTPTATAATTETPATTAVDPKSKDSYYYYGTSEAEKTTELKPATAAVPAATATPDSAVVGATEDGRKAKADYNQAYQLLVSKPAEAVPLFRSFLEKYPQHELAANAQYWLAEALYAQKDFEGASKEFMKVLKQYKDSPKSSGAALKLGYSFYELQQWEYARRTLEDTVRFFPDSSSAKLAEARLQKMKEEGH